MLTGLLGSGCAKPPEVDLLAQGEQLALDQKWYEAIPVLNRHLLEHPGDSGAHFYLGRCYLNRKPPLFMFGDGELETALNEFLNSGKHSTIARFSDAYFESMCHIERTKGYLRQADFVMSQPVAAPEVRQDLLRGILRRCTEELDAARAIDPESHDVKDLEEILDGLRRTISAMPATPAPPDKTI